MPNAPRVFCNRCRKIHGSGECEVKRKVVERRESAAKRGYGWWWRNENKTGMADRFIAEHPLCAECERHGRVVPGYAVDHIIPHRGDVALLKDWGNLQTLCQRCHNAKAASERL